MRRSSIVAGPRIDFFPQEIDALKKYLANGGKLLLALDPPEKPDGPPLTNLVALAREWGIDVGNDVVVDVSGMGRLIGHRRAVPVAATYPPHPITQRFNVMTAYPAGAIGHAGERRRRTAAPRSRSSRPSRSSWAETRHQGAAAAAAGQAGRVDEGDKTGPRRHCRGRVGAGRPRPPPKPPKPADPTRRSPKPGSSSSATRTSRPTRGLGIPGNRDLFMNTVGWLSQQENLISVRPKEAEDRRITLTAAQQTQHQLARRC